MPILRHDPLSPQHIVHVDKLVTARQYKVDLTRANPAGDSCHVDGLLHVLRFPCMRVRHAICAMGRLGELFVNLGELLYESRVVHLAALDH